MAKWFTIREMMEFIWEHGDVANPRRPMKWTMSKLRNKAEKAFAKQIRKKDRQAAEEG